MVGAKKMTVGSLAPVVPNKQVLTEAPDGHQSTQQDPDFARQTTLVNRIIRERREALRALAK